MLVFDLVIYHASCPDGFTAAWPFKRIFPNIDLYPCSYGQNPPNVTGKIVAIVDFSFPKNVLQSMAKEAKHIVVLDHHRSAERDLASVNETNVDIIFDMARSGAQIAWDYIYPSEPRPWVVDYVADRDLWKHELPHTKEISQALWFDGYYNSFDKLNDTILKSPSEFAERGRALLEYKNFEIKSYADHAKPTKMTVAGHTYTVFLVGCPRQYRSDVGNLVAENNSCDFAATYWYDFSANNWYISLRASHKSRVDLSVLASNLPEGGGHPKAAGFTIYGNKGQTMQQYFRN